MALFAPQVFACTCFTESTEKALEHADSVFTGTVRSIKKVSFPWQATPHKAYMMEKYEVEFQVDYELKNAKSKLITVYTKTDNLTACGYKFELNKKYAVFGYVTEDKNDPDYIPEKKLSTNSCTKTVQLNDGDLRRENERSSMKRFIEGHQKAYNNTLKNDAK